MTAPRTDLGIAETTQGSLPRKPCEDCGKTFATALLEHPILCGPCRVRIIAGS